MSISWLLCPRSKYPSADEALEVARHPDARVRLAWTVPGNSWPVPWVEFPMHGAVECWLVSVLP